ncbi:MAG TPA: orotidine-5'-phosphate decarboxylase [Balneolaceae bacterium]|nr:orotidine-5'-phosphate decarboxylase [Balneolaceae bacterium]
MTFTEKLKSAVQKYHSTLCVGLDPNLDLLPDTIKNRDAKPAQKVTAFLKRVIDVTHPHCAAYKPNLGFFEALGVAGWQSFQQILDYIPDDKIIIADAKRGDISSTAEHYAKAFFEKFEVDAITLNPLMGFETLNPFLNDSSKGVYILALTSNPGASDILLQKFSSGQTVSAYIVEQLNQKQQQSQSLIGMVVGATKTADLQSVIQPFSEAPLLIPGVGKQGGSVDELASVLENHSGIPLINSSRSIIYAGNKSQDWDDNVKEAAKNLKLQLGKITQRYV